MKYNPQIHHRRSIRLKGYDYSQAGAYFITICCHNRTLRFGTIEVVNPHNIDVQMILTDFGQIAYNEWAKLPGRFPNVELDVFQIMPNHMHGIIVLNDAVGATLAVAPDNTCNDNLVADDNAGNKAEASRAPTAVKNENKIVKIGDIVGAYKSLVANGCLDLFKTSIESGTIPKNEIMGKIWQRNFHEHIIRNEQDYQKIVDYIVNNPKMWKEDKFFKSENM